MLDFLEKIAIFNSEINALPDYDDVYNMHLGEGYGDAEGLTYYGIVRWFKPDLIIEFGCGVSTFYANEALKRNGSGVLVCVEPYPKPAFESFCDQNNITLLKVSADSVAVSELVKKLTNRSIVFVDTTHVVKVGSEVGNYFMNVLPKVPSGALVHFHDIFFPYEVLFKEHDGFRRSAMWNESVCLGIFLSQNDNWHIVHPGYWLACKRPVEYRKAIPRLQIKNQVGSSFWMRRK